LISGPSTDQWSKRDDAALLSFPITGNFDVQVRVIFDPSKNYQSAGLGIRSANDPLTWIRITRSYFDGQVFGVGRTVQGVSTPFTPVNYGSDTIYLRIERRGEFVTLSYHGEGKNWIALEKDHEIKLSEKVEIYLITYSTDTFAGATAQFSDLSILPAG